MTKKKARPARTMAGHRNHRKRPLERAVPRLPVVEREMDQSPPPSAEEEEETNA